MVQTLGMLVILLTFDIQLLAGDSLFAGRLRRHTDAARRVTLGFAAELLLGVLVYLICALSDFWLIRNALYYLLLFGLSLIPLFCGFDEPPMTLILCGVSGYLAQHIGSQFNQTLLFDLTSVEAGGLGFVRFLATQLVVYGATYTLIYFLFARHTTRAAYTMRANRSLFWLSVTTLLVVIILSSVRDNYAGESFALMVVSRLFSVFCCIFLLWIRSVVLEQSAMEQERETLVRLHQQELEQYQQRRENIELINIKCHDLRHRIEDWERRGGQADSAELQEMKEIVNIYDANLKTGNDTLDTILTERSLYCEKHGIRLSCMADGSKLGFLSVGEIYSLFANALENAIEAVSKLEDEAARNISFIVRENRGMLVINIDNCYSGELTFEDGLPKTTKSDEGYHGYGMKSIRLIAQQYGGEATVAADELFHLSVLIPIPTEA